MRVLIIGAEGLLGTTVHRLARADRRVSTVVGAGHRDVDVTRPAQVRAAVRDVRPDVVINTAVLKPVETCEEHPDEAYAVNTLGARCVSAAAAEVGACAVYLTTDLVFDGTAKQPYGDACMARPLHTYGVTKLAGEHETRLANDKHLILRTAGLFGPRPASAHARPCAVDRMLDQALASGELEVVDDVWLSPTYTVDLAGMIFDLLAEETPSGTYHMVNRGITTWYEFCHEALTCTGLADRVRLKAGAGPIPAPRPPSTPLRYTVLTPLGTKVQDWRTALHSYLATSRPREMAVGA